MEKERIFVNGLWSYAIPESAPSHILGRHAYKVSEFIKFLEDHKQFAVDGYLYIDIKESKTGKRYGELDIYQYSKNQKEQAEITQDLSGYEKWQASMDKALPVIQQDEPVDVSDIPF